MQEGRKRLRSVPLGRLVFPIAQEKWIVRMSKDEKTCLGRRKSPKKGNIFHLFDELVYIPGLITHPNFSLETLLIQEEEVRCDDGTGSWRRHGLRIADHRLIDVLKFMCCMSKRQPLKISRNRAHGLAIVSTSPKLIRRTATSGFTNLFYRPS